MVAHDRRLFQYLGRRRLRLLPRGLTARVFFYMVYDHSLRLQSSLL